MCVWLHREKKKKSLDNHKLRLSRNQQGVKRAKPWKNSRCGTHVDHQTNSCSVGSDRHAFIQVQTVKSHVRIRVQATDMMMQRSLCARSRWHLNYNCGFPPIQSYRCLIGFGLIDSWFLCWKSRIWWFLGDAWLL